MAVLDADAPKIITRLGDENILYLYHFTSIENLPGISKHKALCSKEYLESCGDWPVIKPGGNSWSHEQDRRHDNWGYIATSLTPQTQMFFRRKSEERFCFFLISLEVAGWRDVLFTDTNSAKNGHNRETGLGGLDLINFEMVRAPYIPQDENWHKYHMAEVLVPNRIPIEFISKIAFVSEISSEEGKRLWGGDDHPEFIIDRLNFQNIPNPLHRNTGFPYVTSIMLTDSRLNRENYREVTTNLSQFDRIKASVISAIIKINTIAGTKGKVIWSPNGIESDVEFPNSRNYTWWPHVSIDELPDGPGIMEIRLNDIVWATKQYEVTS